MRQSLLIGVILLLIPTYIGVVHGMPMAVRSTCAPTDGGVGVTDRVGFCERIGFSVERSYYLGLLRLPVHPAGVNVDLVNRVFLPALLGVAGFIWWRGRDRRENESSGYAPSAGERETVPVTTT